MSTSVLSRFDLSGRVAVITGGAGLLGIKHAEAIAEAGGIPVLLDLDAKVTEAKAEELSRTHGRTVGFGADVRSEASLKDALGRILESLGRVDILINNAARNPKMESGGVNEASRLEHYPLAAFEEDIAVGLTGAMLASRVFGAHMAKVGRGVILNVASDLGVIAPDQRIYRKNDRTPETQPVKPVSYSVVKHGLIGLTKYLATYWAESGVRVNSVSPGGVYAGQDPKFVEKLTQLIPMGRMANADEYKAAVVFLVSDASSYMTGANVSIDGGRTVW